MKRSYFPAAALIALLLPAALFGQSATPSMKSVDPGSAKPGDTVIVTGENLDKSLVEKVYLTNGKDDFVVEVLDQQATTVKFKVPAKVKIGRLALMLLTRGKEPKLIEQPVKLTIEEAAAQPPQ